MRLSCLFWISSSELEILFRTFSSLFFDFMMILLRINTNTRIKRPRYFFKKRLFLIKTRFFNISYYKSTYYHQFSCFEILFDLSDDFYFFDLFLIKSSKSLKSSKKGVILDCIICICFYRPQF